MQTQNFYKKKKERNTRKYVLKLLLFGDAFIDMYSITEPAIHAVSNTLTTNLKKINENQKIAKLLFIPKRKPLISLIKPAIFIFDV